MTIPWNSLMVVDEEGNRKIDSKKFRLYFATFQPDSRSMALTGKEPIMLSLILE